jgi:TetR/AcrR family transcriptional regulator, mexJK operon transcriptional repressor
MSFMTVTASERKREAIARAALALFSQDGYDRTSVDAIAAEAGVSKRTVYSHYGDKESLFLSVVHSTLELMRERFGEITERTLTDVDDVTKSLTVCMREVTHSVTRSPERAMLTRLVLTEASHFPVLLQEWRGRGLTPLLAQPIAQLSAAGKLHADDPVQAAAHLSALTMGQINNRSMMGTFSLSDEELDQIITSGIEVFLCAYGPKH